VKLPGKKIWLFLVFWLVLAAAGPASAETEKYTLANGLEVLLIENHRAPVVSMMVYVKVGSASEGPDEIGLAHLMEHMLFKGTTRRGPGRIAREVEAAGGEINAYTSYDQTVYYINMAGRFAERGLDVLADMVFHPALDAMEYAREKEVVIEEIKRGEDNPERRISQALFAQAYQVHPYGRPVIGYADKVRNISQETAVAFHRRWYRPGNMILAVAGDFESAEMRRLIEKYFGSAPGGPVPEHDRGVEPAQERTRTALLREDVQTARLKMGFHIPEYASKETTAMDMLAVILGQGRTSRLYREVKRAKELVHQISAGAYTPRDPGLFVIEAQLAPDKTASALKAVLAEISALIRDGISPEDLARAKLNIQAEFIHDRATMSGEARTALYFQALAGDYRAKDRYLTEIDRIEASTLRAAAARYFRPENLTVAVMLPKEAAPEITEEVLAKAALEVRAESAEPLVRKMALANGGTLLVKVDRSLPLVSLRAAFLGGLRHETPKLNGLSNFTAEVWDRSTTKRPADNLARAVEDLAGSIGGFSGHNSFGLEGEFLSRHLDKGLELFAEVLTRPNFDPVEVEKARENILAAIKRREDQIPAVTFQLFAQTLYGGHPYGLKVLGSAETVKGITPGDLRAFYEKWARPADLVLTVVGDVDPDGLKKRLDGLFGNWTGKSVKSPEVPPPAREKGLKTVRRDMDRAQAHLVLGFLAPGLKSADRYALEILDNVLSGMGGRMFVQLRDKQSLAYALSSFYRPGLGTGSFGLYIAFDPVKIDEVQTGLRAVLAGVIEHPITDEELKRAKEYILGTYEIGLQSYGAQASDLAFNELYGLGWDYGPKYLAGLNAVTAAEVQAAARRYLDLNHAVEVVVGKVTE